MLAIASGLAVLSVSLETPVIAAVRDAFVSRSSLVPARGKSPGLIWVPFTAYLRFPNLRQSRLQDCRLRWRAAAELRRAVSATSW